MNQRLFFFTAIMLFFSGWAFTQGSGIQVENTYPGEQFDVFIPSRTGPTVIPGSDPLPRSFRKLALGMSLDELKDALTENEVQALSLILRDDNIKKFAVDNNVMLEVLVDGINEKAMDYIGDNILDGELAVYDDYAEQVKIMVG